MTLFRQITLVAYGGALILLHCAELLAQKVYDDLCSKDGISFHEPTTLIGLVLVMIIFSVPPLLARSRVLVIADLTASLITLAGSVLLLSTASRTPYECFTMGGTYEDHTSGLGEFVFWGGFVLLLSFGSLFVDLLIWVSKAVMARLR
jgi:hypothetical protein